MTPEPPTTPPEWHEHLQDPARNESYYTSAEQERKYVEEALPVREKVFEEPRIQWVAEAIKNVGAKSVLDCAAKDGMLAEVLPEGVEYVGIELNQAAIDHAFPRAKGKILRGNIQVFDYGHEFVDKSFDVVFAGEVLEHLPDPGAFLRSVLPILSAPPKGIVITTSALGMGKGEPGNHEHLREWDPPGFRALHEGAGYEVILQGVAEVYRRDADHVRFTNCIVAGPRGKKHA